jgi:hypothetical protein
MSPGAGILIFETRPGRRDGSFIVRTLDFYALFGSWLVEPHKCINKYKRRRINTLEASAPTRRTLMTAISLDTASISLDTASIDGFRLRESLSWRDPDIDCTLVVSQPSTDRGLWDEYVLGAHRSYRKHGVECALDVDALRSGADTVMYLAVIDSAGRMVAGVRAKGPLQSADDSHAIVEWAGQPGQQAVRKLITDRVPFGILEMKSAWVTDDPDKNRCITTALARSGFHMMALLDVQFCMATAAAYVLNRWRSSGGVVAAIPAAPYPDERYQTKMMWWNRRDFVNHAEPEQVAKILVETQQLTLEFDRQCETKARRFGGA